LLLLVFFCSSLVTHLPSLASLQTRIQTSQSNPFRINGLYGGVGSSLFGLVPNTVLTFGSYEIYKKRLKERFPNLKPILTYAIAAVLGDLTGSIWLCPPEVVKQQMQAGMYSNTVQAVTNIWRQEGVRGFYRGYLGSVARDVPFRVAQLTTYEVAKGLYLGLKTRRKESRARNTLPVDEELTPAESAVLGGLAGVVSSVVTQPM
jgi:solute carrier family 25 (mitochondrial S-adenosylmethionine transporter), member 26